MKVEGLLLVVLLNFVGNGVLIPILPFTVVKHLSYAELVMTLLPASFAVAMFIGNPVLGWLSARLDKKYI